MNLIDKQSLPNGWKWTTLGDSFKWGSGGTPLRSNPSFYNGDIPWVIIGDLADSIVLDTKTKITEEGLRNSSAKWVEPGSVLIAMYGSIGKLGIAGKRLTTNQAIAFTKSDHVLSKYLFYYLLSQRANLNNLGMGATQQNISQTIIKTYPFPLAPLPEQQRIVAKIDELFSQLDTAEAALKRARANLKRYRQSVLQAAVTGELTREWRESHQGEIERINRKLPKGWNYLSIQEIGFHRLGKMLDKEKNTGKPRKYLRNANVRWFEFDLSDLHEMKVTDEKLESVLVKKGDLLICEGGEPGRSAVWEYESDEFVFQKALHRLRFSNSVLPHFIMYRLAVDAFTGKLSSLFTGSTIKHLTAESLLKYSINIPPIEEQNLIIKEIDDALYTYRNVDSSIEINIRRINTLRQSVLISAFRGELI